MVELNIEQIEEQLVQNVHDMIAAFKQADTKVKSPEEVQQIENLKAQGYTIQDPKVNQAAVDRQVAAIGAFKRNMSPIQLKVNGSKTPREPEKQTNFFRTLPVNTQVAAFKVMKEKLTDVGENDYELVDYDPEFITRGNQTGLVTAKVLSKGIPNKKGELENAGKWVELKYNNPGSLANAIKVHRWINGKATKALAASLQPAE